MPSPPGQVRVAYAISRAATGSLTWGQEAILDVLRWLPPDDTTLNLWRTCAVPAGLGIPAVLSAIAVLVERNDALHTVYIEDEGATRQRLLASGEIEAEIVDVSHDAATEAARVREELLARTFDIEVGPLMYVAVVTENGTPRYVVLVASHMAVDGWSMSLVHDQLTALFHATSQPEGPLPQQPLARAGYEASDEGVRQEQRTLAYWGKQLREIPRAMIEPSSPSVKVPDLEWAELSSKAAAIAVRVLANGAGVRTSTAVLAATAVELGRRTGADSVALRALVATRFRPETRRSVGALNQNALIRIDLAERSFCEVLRATADATLLAYRNCEGSPRKVARIITEVARERGITEMSCCFFNDVRYAVAGSERADLPLPDAEALRHALPDTRVRRYRTPRQPKEAKFFLYLADGPDDRLVLRLGADEAFVGGAGVVGFLEDVERTLVSRAANNFC